MSIDTRAKSTTQLIREWKDVLKGKDRQTSSTKGSFR